MTLGSLIRGNWQLKLLALALALALLFWTSGQVRVERTLTVAAAQATVQGLPADYQISSITPGEFAVEVDGPSTVMGQMRLDTLTPTLQIGAAALEQGRQEFPINGRMLGLGADISLRAVRPQNVTAISVVFGKIVRDTLPVDQPELAERIEGVQMTYALDRTFVTVSGPRAAVEHLRATGARVRFRPIRLPGVGPQIEKPVEERLQLQPELLPGGVTVLDPVMATVRLRPEAGAREIVSLPLGVLAPAGFHEKFRIELSQPQVSVTVRGPKNLLATMKPEEDIVAYVNLRRLVEPIAYENVPVQLIAPAWLAHDPVAIRVTLTLQASGAKPPPPQTPPQP